MVRIVLLIGVLGLGWAGCGDDSGTDNNNPGNQNNQNSDGECGDGVQDPGEACDDGTSNSDAIADACRTDCRLPFCGDGVADSVEECDEAGDNSDTVPGACRTDCSAAHCADGVLDPSEGCDDGNDVSGDGCAPDCTVESHWACDGSPSVCGCDDYYWGDGCGGCAVRVKSDALGVVPTGATWELAFTTVQQGVDVAESLGPGCEVWVAGGTYYIWDSNANDTMNMRTGVTLYGGFAGTETARDQRDWSAYPTVLDGMEESSSPADGNLVNNVVTAYEVQDATLNGFIVTGGYAQDPSSDDDSSGGGMRVTKFTGTVEVGVVNCVFRNNRAEVFGGAIFVNGGTLRLVGSTISSNAAGQQGGAITGKTYAVVTVADSTLSHNLAITGAASYCSGGAIYVDSSVDLSVTGSVFYANQAHHSGSPNVTHGGAIHGSPQTVIRNCTFAFNTASNTGTTAGGAIYEAGEITNSVFTSNSLSAIASGGDVSYSQVQPYQSGTGNDTADPLLGNLPESVHWALQIGDVGLSMVDLSGFAVGDHIEVNNDGVLRTVDSLGGGQLFFSPTGAPFYPGAVVVEHWGPSATTVREDLTLQSGSPCIDTALDSVAPTTDILGNPRADVTGVGTPGTLADRGAFEYQP